MCHHILITGGTGLIGSALSSLLIREGYRVTVLSRRKISIPGIRVAAWEPESDMIDMDAVSQADVIIHLAGENIAGGRWSRRRKQRILHSRVRTARLLYKTVKDNAGALTVFISASAVGYYGALTTREIFKEDHPSGDDFLGSVCRQWEEAAQHFSESGTRTVIIRMGVVLSPAGGALTKMALPFRLGLGSPLGSGKQYIPWIHIDDLCRVFLQAIRDKKMTGAYNGVAPQHADNRLFSQTTARALNKPMRLPAIPGFILKGMLGEMSNMILEGSRVSADKLVNSGFRFQYPTLKEALTDVLSPHDQKRKKNEK